jgi:hypothetical protein
VFARADCGGRIRVGGDAPSTLGAAKLEHDQRAIERKRVGWRCALVRDEARRQHLLLVPRENLKKSPDQMAKDAEQMMAVPRFTSEESGR